MSNIWDDQEPFRDNPVEFKSGGWKEAETYTPAPDNNILRQSTVAQPHQESDYDEEMIEELADQASEEDEEDYSDVLSDARLRLEQGRLYEMVIQHSLFEGLDADPRAIKSVQNQIRKFARERMEIMLGIRQEESTANNSFVSSPFNDLEVIVLKKMASTFSKGATESEEASVPQEVMQVTAPKKKTTLNSIGTSKPKIEQTKPKIAPKVQAKPIQKAGEPIKRAAKPKLEVNAEGLLTGKALHEMTEAEKQEKIKQNIENQKGKIAAMPKDRMPMPDYNTMEMLAQTQASKGVGTLTKNNFTPLIMAALKKKGSE
jgi:hypothetical protein